MGRKKSKVLNGRSHKFAIEVPYPIALISHLRDNAIHNDEDQINLDGDVVNIRSLRLDNFFEHGFDCVCCGAKGVHFIKERARETEPYHINLYAIRDDGREVLMTKDHIIPKSLGGLDIMENMQPYCAKCNGKKGNTMPNNVPPELVALGEYLNRSKAV